MENQVIFFKFIFCRITICCSKKEYLHSFLYYSIKIISVYIFKLLCVFLFFFFFFKMLGVNSEGQIDLKKRKVLWKSIKLNTHTHTHSYPLPSYLVCSRHVSCDHVQLVCSRHNSCYDVPLVYSRLVSCDAVHLACSMYTLFGDNVHLICSKHHTIR